MTASPLVSLPDLLAQALRRTGREFESTVKGSSMRGTLPDGSRIRIRCDGADGLAEGQVVAFVRGSLLVAHRLIARGRRPNAARYLVTLGDGTAVCDAPVPVDAVLGTVVACEAGGAWLPVPAAPARRGWRRSFARLLLAGVRLALEADVRLAAALVECAQFAQRMRGAALGTPGQRESAV